jgi:Fumarylacetoacetate (FAA) hydrolase family
VRIANLAGRLVLITPPTVMFTKWQSCITGPVTEVELPDGGTTGTPAGVGMGRTPRVFLAPGDELVSYVAGIGELRQRFVAAPQKG